MTLWISFTAMGLVAIGFAAWPLYRHQKRFTALIGITIVGVAGLSAGLYAYNGSPELPSARGSQTAVDDVVRSLAERLAANPEDLSGWKMLGRSYMAIGNHNGAVTAFEKAMALESAQNAQTLVSLGEALLAGSGSGVNGRIATLFENALSIDPNNSQALFYGGIGAYNRADPNLAADRWERLLTLNPPAEIEEMLHQRIAEWRGQEPPALVEPTAPVEPAAPVELSDDAVISVAISLSAAATEALAGHATIYVIALDPSQPRPPIAVVRRVLSDLPTTVELGDRESMVPGRSLSGFAEFELIVRVSISGQPTAQPGDWYGSMLVKPAENNRIELSIDQKVP